MQQALAAIMIRWAVAGAMRRRTRAKSRACWELIVNEKTTVGLVLRVLADTAIRLDGDGWVKIDTKGIG